MSQEDDINKYFEELAQHLEKSKEEPPLSQLKPSIEKEQLQLKILYEVKNFEQTLKTGVEELFKTLVEMAKSDPGLFKDSLAQDLGSLVRFNASLDKEEEMDKYTKELEQGKTIQEICNISDETIQHFYQAATYLYGKEEHVAALSIFSVLVYLNPKQPLFWLGLGNCSFFLGAYPLALQSYATCSMVDPKEYRSQLYAARCYEELNQIDLAIQALKIALIAAEGKPEVIAQIQEEKKRLERKRK